MRPPVIIASAVSLAGIASQSRRQTNVSRVVAVPRCAAGRFAPALRCQWRGAELFRADDDAHEQVIKRAGTLASAQLAIIV